MLACGPYGVRMLQFDKATYEILERAYQGADFRDRRRESFQALHPQPGERLADIGCGNGLLTRELALAVGPHGEVLGVDPSPDMISLAVERSGDLDNFSLLAGTAEEIPIADRTLDGAMSLQVFEYLEDPRAAVRELHRVLRQAGRSVIGDMHFGTLCWFSEHPARMTRMCDSWRRHVADIALPETLPSIFAQ